MNKTDFIAEVAQKADMTKAQALKAVNAFTEVIAEQMRADEKVTILGFGTFSVATRSERKGVNPRDPKKTITIPARKVVKFKPGAGLDLSK